MDFNSRVKEYYNFGLCSTIHVYIYIVHEQLLVIQHYAMHRRKK